MIELRHLLLESDSYIADDASGLYWVSEQTRDRHESPPGSKRKYKWVLDGKMNINTRVDDARFSGITGDRGVDLDVLNVTLQVNRAAEHLSRRIIYFRSAYEHLCDDQLENSPYKNLRP